MSEKGIDMKKENRFFIGSIVGLIATMICCFTPLLVVLFGVVGLGALVGHLDYILIPALIVFIVLTIISYRKRMKKRL